MRPRGCPSASAAGERLARRGDSERHKKGRSGQQCGPRRRATLLAVDGLHRILLQVHGVPTLAETARREYLVGFLRCPSTKHLTGCPLFALTGRLESTFGVIADRAVDVGGRDWVLDEREGYLMVDQFGRT
jgi:hypothetical protein